LPVTDPTQRIPQRIGYFDIKGSGAADPRPGAYTNGLMTLGEALREYLMEHLIRRVLAHSGTEVTSVGSYGVIDLGFNVIHDDGTQSRAGLYVRPAQANRHFDHIRGRKIVTATLQRYGILAEAPQGTSVKQLVDFGSYTIRRPEQIGAIPELSLDFDKWGIDESKIPAPGREQFFWGKWEQPWYRMHDLAEDLARGQKTPEEVEAAVKSWIDGVDQKLFGRTWSSWTPPERLRSPPLPCSLLNSSFLK